MDAQEPVREHATAKEGTKLLLDEAGSGLLSVCSAREEAFELLANDLMKESLLRLMAVVLGHAVPGRDRVGAPREKLEPIGPHGTRATLRSDAVALRAMEAVPRALSMNRSPRQPSATKATNQAPPERELPSEFRYLWRGGRDSNPQPPA